MNPESNLDLVVQITKLKFNITTLVVNTLTNHKDNKRTLKLSQNIIYPKKEIYMSKTPKNKKTRMLND